MLDKRQFEDCYCPEGKDKAFPQNWRRTKYVLDYPDDVEPPYISDGDTQAIVHKAILVDPNLDNYTLGVYLRLNLLTEYYHPWGEIYEWGNPELIDKAMKTLEQQGYIEYLPNDALKIYE